MGYPPKSRTLDDPDAAVALMRAHPFAHCFTAHTGLRATRTPFLVDIDDQGRPARLRGHIDATNPQAVGLDGNPVLVAFSGHATYVSPHWRANKNRGGTYDYEEVIVRGTARVVEGIDAFRELIDDLSALIEPQYEQAGDYPVWQTDMAPEGYIEKLVGHLTQFVVDIDDVECISKLHRDFSEADRRTVADHLERCDQEYSRAIGEKIRRLS